MLTLGVIAKVATELVEPFTRHFMFRKSCMPRKVSSMFKMTLPEFTNLMYSIAHRYLRTKFKTEFEVMETFLSFR